MRRFLLVWIFLAIPLVVTTLAVSMLGFRHLDLRYVTFVQLLVIPTVQAAVVTWVSRQWSLSRLASVVRETARHRLVGLLFVSDLGFLSLGIVVRGHPVLGVGGQGSVHPRWAAVKALMAGAVLLVAVRGRRDGGIQKPWVLGLAGCAVALGLDVFIPWMAALPELIHEGPLVIRWLIVYGGMSALGLVVLIQASAAVRPRSSLAAFYLDLAGACVFAVVIVYALNIYLRPFLVEPWVSVARALASVSATSILVGSLLTFGYRGRDR